MTPSLMTQLLSLPNRFYYGWRIVVVGGLINAVANGLYNYGFGIFFLPVSRDLELTRAETSLIFSLSRTEGALEGPLAGYLVDRFGPRPMMIAGAVLTGIGYIVLSQANSYLSFLLIYLVLISFSHNAGFAHSTLTAVNTWFIRQRGLAMSAVTATAGVGGAVIAPTLAIIVAAYGWRTASVVAGLALILFVVPLAALMKRSPESMGLQPDGDAAPLSAADAQAAIDLDFTVREGLRTRVFWIMAAATTMRLAVMNTVTIQFIPIMVWKGQEEVAAAFLFAAMTGLSGPGRITMGWLGDRFPKNVIIGVGMLAGSCSFVLLQFAEHLWQIWMFVLAFAVVESVNTLNWALIGDYYGRRSFATLRGTMSLIYTTGVAIAPVAAGFVYDRTQSYDFILCAMAVIYLTGALVFFSLRPPGRPVRSDRPFAAPSPTSGH